MKEFMINLDSVTKIAKFVALATELTLPITVTDGRNTAGSNSIMELVCLNIREPLVASADCTDEEFSQLLRKVEPFLAN